MSAALLRSARSQLFLPATRAFATLPALPLSPPSPSAEEAQFQARVKETQAFFDQPRFANVKRPYTAEAVASKQGSLPVLPLPSTLLADKLWRLFEERAKEDKPVHTMGAVDPVQMTQMAPHQEVVYVSGWACSSLLTTCSNEVGPDIGCVTETSLSTYYNTDSNAETIPTQQYRIKCSAFSVHNNSTIRNIMMNALRLPRKPEQRCHTLITLGPSLRMATWGMFNLDILHVSTHHKCDRHGGPSTVMKLMKLFAESVRKNLCVSI